VEIRKKLAGRQQDGTRLEPREWGSEGAASASRRKKAPTRWDQGSSGWGFKFWLGNGCVRRVDRHMIVISMLRSTHLLLRSERPSKGPF